MTEMTEAGFRLQISDDRNDSKKSKKLQLSNKPTYKLTNSLTFRAQRDQSGILDCWLVG